MPVSNTASKIRPLAGLVVVSFGVSAGLITLGPAKMGAKGALLGPFVVSALITLVVIAGLGWTIGLLRERRRTNRADLSVAKAIVITAIIMAVVVSLTVLITLLRVGFLKITLPPFWWAVIWGAAAGILTAIGLLVYKATSAPASVVRN